MNGFDLAALDTLPHRLPGDAQPAHDLVHGESALGGLFCDAAAQLVGEANAPRGAWCQLLAGDDAVVEPTMNGGGCDAERRGGLFDRQRFAFGRRRRRLMAIDVPMATQIADVVGGEAMTISA
jgi:hypothetical protein